MTKKAPSFTKVKRGYGNLWRKATIRSAKQADIDKVIAHAFKYRARYEEVATKIGKPQLWPLIAAIHWREAAGSFAGVLHNGEHIIGTGRKTRLQPPNRGPFNSWAAAAVDALVLKGWHKIDDWCIEQWLYRSEAFNGWGYYQYRGVNSPYLWAATSLQQYGKYVADGKWSSTAWDAQLGVVAILKGIFAKDPSLEPKVGPIDITSPEIITATTAGAGAIVATASDETGLALGLSVAFVFLLAAWVQQNKGNTMNLGFIFKNGKTTALGVAGVLGGLGTLITMLANSNYDPQALMGVAGSIATGIGLIVAKDGNVTGGTKPSA